MSHYSIVSMRFLPIEEKNSSKWAQKRLNFKALRDNDRSNSSHSKPSIWYVSDFHCSSIAVMENFLFWVPITMLWSKTWSFPPFYHWVCVQLMTIIDFTINTVCECISFVGQKKFGTQYKLMREKTRMSEQTNEKLKTTKHRTMTWRHFLWPSKWKSYQWLFFVIVIVTAAAAVAVAVVTVFKVEVEIKWVSFR